jgi:solute carrier family 25 S-adenosylmethionine transporter 26
MHSRAAQKARKQGVCAKSIRLEATNISRLTHKSKQQEQKPIRNTPFITMRMCSLLRSVVVFLLTFFLLTCLSLSLSLEKVQRTNLKRLSVVSRSTFLTSLVVAVPLAAVALEGTNGTSVSPKVFVPEASVSKLTDTLQESLSGILAGGALTFTKTLVKYPLDTATVRLQMPLSDYSISDPIRLLDGSYRGFVTPLLANIPAGAVFFGVKDAFKGILRESTLSPWVKTSLAVAAAQVPYWLVRNPSEVVKTRQQANVEGFGEGVSALDAYRKVRDETMSENNSSTTGIEGFYTGFWENILYAFPADVIKFVVYDALTGGRKDLPPAQGAIAGAASTAIAQFTTTPLDVVRNRIMAKTSDDKEPSSYLGALVDLAKTEGLPGLFAGASPRVGKALLSGAIQFATYEETKQKLAKAFGKQ